jgi:DNA polymerase elongation subunit (family B)
MRPHYIRHNVRARAPYAIIVVDTETKPRRDYGGVVEHEFYLECHVVARRYGKKWYDRLSCSRVPLTFYSDLGDMLEKYHSVWVFAHNMHFDFASLQVARRLTEWGCKMARPAVFDSNRFAVAYNCPNLGKVRFVDTLNYFKASIEELGRLYGIEKVRIEDWRAVDDRTLFKRCETDVIILYNIIRDLITWWVESGLGNFAPTAPGLAWSAFRHRFMKHRILAHKNRELEDRELQAYYGGRVEVFRIGRLKGPFYQLDVNSMYPAVMRNGAFPVRPVGHLKEATRRDILSLPRGAIAHCLCYIDTDTEIYPKRLQGAGLVFPVGRFVTRLIDPELREAARRGHLAKAEDCYVYHAEPVFREFVDYFWQLRVEYKQKGDRVREQFAKLIMNSLYGKFAQRTRTTRYLGSDPRYRFFASDFVDNVEGRTGRMYWIAHDIIAQYRDREPWANAVIAISAAVTSHARLALWLAIEAAGTENVVYCDTDSLIVNETGLQRLKPLIGDNLGQLKVERVINELVIHAPKDYAADSVTKLKGISKTARWPAPNVAEFEHFMKYKSALKWGREAPMVETLVRELRREVKKRVVLEDGRTEPIRLAEW